jgi:hypothetical protein
MMQSKRTTLVLATALACAALAACSSLPSAGQLGGLSGGGAQSSGNLDGDVKAFLDTSTRVESTFNKASVAIAAAYDSEEKRAEWQAKFDSIGKSTDPKEAGANFQAISESTEAVLKKITQQKDFAEKTAAMSDAKKKMLAAAVGNFLLGALQAKDLAPTGQNVMKAAGSNPMNLGKVLPVKDALPRLINATTLAGSTLPEFVKVLKGANVEVPAITLSSKPAQLDKLN